MLLVCRICESHSDRLLVKKITTQSLLSHVPYMRACDLRLMLVWSLVCFFFTANYVSCILSDCSDSPASRKSRRSRSNNNRNDDSHLFALFSHVSSSEPQSIALGVSSTSIAIEIEKETEKKQEKNMENKWNNSYETTYIIIKWQCQVICPVSNYLFLFFLYFPLFLFSPVNFLFLFWFSNRSCWNDHVRTAKCDTMTHCFHIWNRLSRIWLALISAKLESALVQYAASHCKEHVITKRIAIHLIILTTFCPCLSFKWQMTW